MVQKERILLIEDEEDIAMLIRLHADLLGYSLHVEVDGVNGYCAVEREKPDIVLIDVMLPGQTGFDVCRKIKNNDETKHIPVIILSAKTEELDVILGLELGADDYVHKPFSLKVLFSRIKAVLRRGKAAGKDQKVFSFGDFTLDVSRYLLKKRGEPVTITLSEFGILKRLVSQRGKVFTRNELLDDVHNDYALIVDRNIDVHVAGLRRKLGPDFNWIEAVRGVGYRLREDPIP